MTDFRNDSGLEFADISTEEQRVYDFGERGLTIVDKPIRLNVSESGGHRIFDEDGGCHYIPAGWLHLTWSVKEGSPHFVR